MTFRDQRRQYVASACGPECDRGHAIDEPHNTNRTGTYVDPIDLGSSTFEGEPTGEREKNYAIATLCFMAVFILTTCAAGIVVGVYRWAF